MPPRGLLNAFLPLLSNSFLFCSLAFYPPNACMSLCRQADCQAAMLFSICVAAFGAVVAACGVFDPYFCLGKRPTFAPKRQGKAESAYRRPRPVLLLGSRKVSGDRCLAGSVTTGLSPIRLLRIFVSSKTQQGVLKDTARCPLSNSKGFGLLPKRPCPSRGGLPLRSREACFHLRCGCRKLRLCRDTTKSIII